MKTTPASLLAVPAPLVATIADLLARRHLDRVLAGILAVLAPHVAPTPRPDGTDPVLVDIVLVRQVSRMLADVDGLAVLADVLTAVEPYVGQRAERAPAVAVTLHEYERLALTAREREVLAGMSQGQSNAEIGRSLFVTEDTVKTHARRLFRKLGARDRAHAVRIGFDRGHLLPSRPTAARGSIDPARAGHGTATVRVAS